VMIVLLVAINQCQAKGIVNHVLLVRSILVLVVSVVARVLLVLLLH